jgi:translation initiation factor IF-1
VARKGDFQVEGVVIGTMRHTTFRVQLSNGHIVLGHLSEKNDFPAIPLLPGDKVLLEMTPYDLSRGRIITRQKELVSRAGDLPSDR